MHTSTVPYEELEHAGHRYAVQFTYALPDDAWYLELSQAVPAPAAWANIDGAASYLPGPALATAIVPDEDPHREPLIHFGGDHEIPYEVFRWFMDHVADEVRRCREALAGEDGEALLRDD